MPKRISELTAKGSDIAADDLFEVSVPDDTGGYQTFSVTGQEIIDAVLALVPNIYNSDGTLSADRIVTLADKTLTFSSSSTGKLIISTNSDAITATSTNGNAITATSSTGKGLTASGIGSYFEVVGESETYESSAAIHVASISKGFLPPRVSNTQRDAIISPADYLEITNTTKNRKEFYHPLKGFTPVSEDNEIFTALKEGDNEFVIMASIIGRAGGTFGNGNPITWEILSMSDNHNSSFFRTVSGNSTSKHLEIGFPTVKSILSFIITPDEIISGYGITMAASVGTNLADITTTINHSGYTFLIGAGSTTWTKSGGTSSQITAGTFSTTDGYTLVTFGSSFSHTENAGIAVVYQGANNYRIERSFSGGASNTAIRFRMIDNTTNSPVLTAPTSSDYIAITGAGKYRINLNMSEYSTSVLANNQMINNNNFWCIGMFELWLKVLSISSETMLAKWQTKSGVTTYKLYRDTLEDLSTKMLIYSGTDLEFLDSGLTADTLYYYQLCDQSDVEITQFSNRTKV